jgi:beta-glucosidase
MNSTPKELQFPEGFLWGAATSAHQIEGGLTNDWSAWETSKERREELRSKGLLPEDFISGHAANSFVEQNADIQCLVDLHANAYRFSVDWSRIEPKEGVFDESALLYYKQFIQKLRAHNIEPFVTLWHWPIPLWMRDKGGWESKEMVMYFSRFVEKVVSTLHDDVTFWVTLNEPMVYSSMSYFKGYWPPKKKSIISYVRVIRRLIEAHQAAFHVIKKIDAKSQIGIAKHNIYFEAYKNYPHNRIAKSIADWWWNKRFLRATKDMSDFIGLNYYFHSLVRIGGEKHIYEKSSDLGWGLHPKSIYFALKELQQFKKPIYITEHGLADKGDQHRSWYVRESLFAVHQAIEEGIDVKGYFHWSLIDNFEWAEGFKPRFGLFEVDFKTYERKARASAEYYADICKRNRVV